MGARGYIGSAVSTGLEVGGAESFGVAPGTYRHLYLEVPGAVRPAELGGEGASAEWARLLGLECALRSARGILVSPEPSSLLIGGVAPASLGRALPRLVRELLEAPELRVGEWTVEVEPGWEGGVAADPRSTVGDWMEGGVTRICLRADPTARPGGWSDERVSLLENIAELDPPVLAADLIFRPGDETLPALFELLDRLQGSGVSHLSFYEGAEEDSASGERLAHAWRALRDRASDLGFESTDVVNLALPGAVSSMATAIQRRWPILGLGPGARSFRNPRRSWNVSAWTHYRDRLNRGLEPGAGGEILSPAEVRLERIWSRLPTREGMRIPLGLGRDEPRLRAWRRAGWVEWGAGRIRLTPEGILRLDGIAVDLAELLSAPRRGAPDL
ncbi:MAG: hypothetical protein EA351_11630 [Gemmatimonadales bacterium]|nr:MAG: hypothetical protein EA351_11630 [Gemmatimonadales bacterium]